ncbi:MAG TPA: hypothetical protein VFW65_13965 [Pseudonocardiaceae bacterium]|nr:hypothetical protein [Pseudonocardiaceae bacterium]
MPLRRLLWQVLRPGATFTVGDVVDDLAAIGAEVDAAKVSNALGYWVDRNRLHRERKGVYHFPINTSTAAPHREPVTFRETSSLQTHTQPDIDDRFHDTERGKEDARGQKPPQAKEGTRRAG